MNLAIIIYYCCVAIYSGMMAVCGHGVTSWPFWIGVFVIIAARECGVRWNDKE